jgi:isoaspartyl peptidase/L-asparaginase-like protein (Ntn-hydrolase superfamily)
VAAATRADGAEAANSFPPVNAGNTDTGPIDTGALDSSPNVSSHSRVDTVGAVVIDHCGRVAAGV